MSERLEKLRRLHEVDPGDAFVCYAIALEHADAPSESIPWFDRAIAADPDHAYSRYHKARAQEAIGAVAEARATLEEGLAVARRTGDAQATNEIEAFLDALP